MKLLELFSGTGSVSKSVGHLYDEIISIDILEKFNPTEVADILKWNYKKYPLVISIRYGLLRPAQSIAS